ncbi:hypothetical protein [Rosenbergiella australiborealis]|uniref:hypothetical protein n=1 Tax=Rosenbergiella australiborealis TaxID=1544696 RepID=UPI001F4E38ED|nr:hypothetical protein [Rosenbergiella australiborealis]
MYYLHKVSDDFFFVDLNQEGAIFSGNAESVEKFNDVAVPYLKSKGYDIFVIENQTGEQ